MATQKINYQKLNEELESILGQLQQADIDVDTATAAYARGQEIIKQLENYLKSAENTVKKVKQTTKA